MYPKLYLPLVFVLIGTIVEVKRETNALQISKSLKLTFKGIRILEALIFHIIPLYPLTQPFYTIRCFTATFTIINYNLGLHGAYVGMFLHFLPGFQ